MDHSVFEGHSFEAVNNQQITEEDVRTFLQSFPEFKDCRFEVEIVQANPDGSQTYGSNLNEILKSTTHDSFFNSSIDHSSILPPELRDQYTRVDSINIPFDNQTYTQQQQMYTRIDPETPYIPPTEDDVKKMLWTFDDSKTPNNVRAQVDVGPTPYYNVQDAASSRSSSTVIEEELPQVYKTPSVQNHNEIKSTHESSTSDTNSNPGSWVDVGKQTALTQPKSPALHGRNNSRSESPNGFPYVKSGERTSPILPTTDNDYRQNGKVQDKIETDVGELAKRFSQPTFVSADEKVTKNGENIQPSRTEEISLPKKYTMNTYRKTPTRRSRTADSDYVGRNSRRHEIVVTHEEKKDNTHKKYQPTKETRENSSRKQWGRRRDISTPQVTLSKNQKYCYINGEKFKMVDYVNGQDMKTFQHSLPVQNGFYPPAPFNDGVRYNPDCYNHRRSSHRKSHKMKNYLPYQDPVIWGESSHYTGLRPISNRAIYNKTPLFGTRDPFMTRHRSMDWNQMVSLPRGQHFYNPPYSNFSMWA